MITQKIYNYLISNQAALMMFLLIQTAQCFHTAFVLMEVTALPSYAKIIYGVLAAIGIELIIVCLIGRGRVTTAKYYKWFYFLMNLYAFHLSGHVQLFDVEAYISGAQFLMCVQLSGLFIIIPAYFLPLAGEELAKELTKEDPTAPPKRKRRTNAEIKRDNEKRPTVRPPSVPVSRAF